MASYATGAQYATPFGLRELRVQVGAVNKALSPAQTLEAHEVLTSAELTGDDAVVATHSFPIKIEGSITMAGMPLAALALITGRSVGETGATPTRVNTLAATQGDIYPYFKLYGRSVSDDGGDIWVTLYKCKLTDGMAGQFAYGEFRTSTLTFTAVPDSANGNKLWDITQHELATALPTS